MPAIKNAKAGSDGAKIRSAAGSKSGAAHIRAVIRDAVFYGEGGARRQAPKGEYDVERRDACIGFCNCAGACAFTLSFDSFLQHLNEGRIALVA